MTSTSMTGPFADASADPAGDAAAGYRQFDHRGLGEGDDVDRGACGRAPRRPRDT